MNKKAAALGLCIGIVLIGSVVWLVLGSQTPHTNRVEIVQDGNVLYSFPLSEMQDQTIRIAAENGSYNVVTIQDGTICVSEAGCPDQICVRSGTLDSELRPIVCLPNKLVIRYAA